MSAVIKLSSPATREFWEIPVLFEDEHLLALDKPAGLLTSPDRYDPERPNLMKLLHTAIAAGKPWARERGLTYLSNAHRLDFETSGVLLLAKSKTVLVKLADLFGTPRVVKEYLALVHGAPAEDRFEIHAPLAPHPTRPGEMRVDSKHGKQSATVCEVLERFRGYTLLRCRLLTGRTHQARVHLRHAGLPLVGDALYGGAPLLLSQLKTEYRLKPGRTERPLLARPALHAARLSLPHPVGGEPVDITSPWPKDLTVAVKYLRRFAAAPQP
jgi:23S rRNA pseudouridine1911/1915/1917 synthase